MALSQNTKKPYSSGMRQFYSFCSQTGLTPTFPSNEDILIHFSVCVVRSVQHSTIKNYLSAIKHYHSSHGYRLSLSAFLLFILGEIKRSQGDNSKIHNIAYIEFILSPLKCEIFRQQRLLMVWAAVALAFFGFLRIGELTGDSHFNLESHLFIFRPIKGFQNRPI